MAGKFRGRKRPDVGQFRQAGPRRTGLVYRVQDREGRGPWRPGFSQAWMEDRSPEEYAALLPVQEEFPGLVRMLRPGYSVGVGCVSLEQLRLWFTPLEYERLLGFGFHCYGFVPARIVCQSDVQCVFELADRLSTLSKRVVLYGPGEGVK